MTTPPKEHDHVRERISELMGPDQDPRKVAHDASVERHQESVSDDSKRKAMLKAASRRFGNDLDGDVFIQRLRAAAVAPKPRYLGSV